MAGARTAFLLCPFDEAATRRTADFVAQAKRAGVQRLVRVSGMGTGAGPDIAVARDQRDSEELLERSGLAWTHLRPNTFMTNFLAAGPSVTTEGALYAPAGDSVVSFVDPRDVAAVAARLLTEDGHDGRSYEVTGPQGLTHEQVAGTIAERLGRPVRYVDIPADAAREAMVASGLTEWSVTRLLEFYATARTDAFWATVTPTVEHLTGRPARTFRTWVGDHAEAFAAAGPEPAP